MRLSVNPPTISSVRTFLLCLVMTLPVFANDMNSQQAPTSQLSLERQKQLIHILKQDCGSCHGMTLKGGLGPALLPENLEGKPALFLKNTILFGRNGTAMPPWKDILNEQEITWLVTQLQNGVENEKH